MPCSPEPRPSSRLQRLCTPLYQSLLLLPLLLSTQPFFALQFPAPKAFLPARIPRSIPDHVIPMLLSIHCTNNDRAPHLDASFVAAATSRTPLCSPPWATASFPPSAMPGFPPSISQGTRPLGIIRSRCWWFPRQPVVTRPSIAQPSG